MLVDVEVATVVVVMVEVLSMMVGQIGGGGGCGGAASFGQKKTETSKKNQQLAFPEASDTIVLFCNLRTRRTGSKMIQSDRAVLPGRKAQ